MKKYIELVLLKEKKPASFDKIVSKIQKIKSDEAGKDVTLSDQDLSDIYDILQDLVKNYEVYQTPSNNFILMSKTSFRKGRFYGDRTGAGRVSVTNSYVDRDGKLNVSTERYDISKDNVNGAIDGDFVLIDLGGSKFPPKVVELLDRKLDYVPGEVYRVGNSYFLRPADKKKQGITIAIEEDAIEGERVAVSIESRGSDNFYTGKIVKRFNHKDDPNEDILWEAFKHGVDNSFSDESMEQLEHIPSTVRDIDRIGREDLTDWTIFTIDGADTKDMDDAISCTINENGNYELGVHITDVASIIPEGSPLDKDAFNKGNSYYLGGTVLPMTPHKISNGIGSLNPYVDRMAISCICEISPEGEVLNYRITPTVINSKLKMTYGKVNDILKNGVVDPEYEEFKDTLLLMQKLSLILRKKRLVHGSIEFNRPELRTIYEDGKVQGFELRVQDVAENLIEEFMLVANETVDKHLTKKGLPCVHRVHSTPNEERVTQLLALLDAVNLPFNDYSVDELCSDKYAYQKFVEHIAKTGHLSTLLTTEAIKCMSRAKYSEENIGHYGLAKENYCHFTSPVRRYSDLTVHRILWDCEFNREKSPKGRIKWEKKVPEIAEKTTHTERVADECERDVLRMLCCEYMADHIGEEFDATVTCVSADNIVVELDNMMEGTVRVKDLKGPYAFSPDTYTLVSLDGEDDYTIGNRLRIKLKSSDKELKRMDFTIIDKIKDTEINNAEEINTQVKIKEKKRRNMR